MAILRSCIVCGALSPERRCPKHRRRSWQDRPAKANRSPLSGTRQQRRARYILDKYGLICHVCGGFGANEVDHVIPLAEGGADDETNLRPIHGKKTGLPCHVHKTAAEAARGRARRQRQPKGAQ